MKEHKPIQDYLDKIVKNYDLMNALYATSLFNKRIFLNILKESCVVKLNTMFDLELDRKEIIECIVKTYEAVIIFNNLEDTYDFSVNKYGELVFSVKKQLKTQLDIVTNKMINKLSTIAI